MPEERQLYEVAFTAKVYAFNPNEAAEKAYDYLCGGDYYRDIPEATFHTSAKLITTEETHDAPDQ